MYLLIEDEPNLPEGVQKLVLAHLKFLSLRPFFYFQEKEIADLLKYSWVLNPFSKADHMEESEKLIDLRNNLEKKTLFDDVELRIILDQNASR